MGRDHRCGHRRAAGAAFGDSKGDVGARQLHRAAGLGQRFALAVGKPDLDAPVDHRDRRRHRAFVGDDLFDIGRHGGIVGIGHAVGDDGAFERHHRLAGGKGRGHRRVDVDEGAGGLWRHVCISMGRVMPFPGLAAQGPASRRTLSRRVRARRHALSMRKHCGGNAFSQRAVQRQATHQCGDGGARQCIARTGDVDDPPWRGGLRTVRPASSKANDRAAAGGNDAASQAGGPQAAHQIARPARRRLVPASTAASRRFMNRQ